MSRSKQTSKGRGRRRVVTALGVAELRLRERHRSATGHGLFLFRGDERPRALLIKDEARRPPHSRPGHGCNRLYMIKPGKT
jgi:hypothetical protein